MSLYGFILLIHVLGAVCGIGASFASPFLLNRAKTAKQAEFAIHVNHSIDKLVVIGTFTLLGTGLILGALNSSLFAQGWYIASLILFVTILPVAGFIVPKKTAQQVEILKNHNGDELPDSYMKVKKQAAPFNRYTYLATIIIIIFMVTKPF
ncbi:DUF2269 family protein [Niallia endozanthoxylica]|uniref:DUF2269 family protein n=1 Tax=Niallia endozanthoxylica TaxID=2036016 RepID=A0A5J5I2U1_9BACI|nr:DUF2269 family protein [Niallia endozanthoxylica]KAA9030612.1 DUF2269 family protein [Niallia endozanthoxylica]